jgi:aryl-alcohol dehydrogenase-like predicted oxidoreductase
MNRRAFLERVGTVASAAALARLVPLTEDSVAAAQAGSPGLPQRVLGRTRQKITILGLGTACVGHSQPGVEKGVPVYRAALEAGVNYVDTAHLYDDAEKYLGDLAPSWRDRIFLATKAWPRGTEARQAAQGMQEQFEQSLRLMKTDHVDLLYIHNLGGHEPAMVLAAGGPLDFVRKMKETGKTRFIGLTGHLGVARFAPVLATGDIDVVMVVLNYADGHTYRFEQDVLPLARKHNCGIVAMKVFGGHSGGFAGYRQAGPAKLPAAALEKAFRYSLGIEGVATAVVGFYSAEEARQTVEWAKRYRPLTGSERTALLEEGRKLAAEWGPRFGPAV